MSLEDLKLPEDRADQMAERMTAGFKLSRKIARREFMGRDLTECIFAILYLEKGVTMTSLPLYESCKEIFETVHKKEALNEK